ncbi:MAG: pyruvate, water dikinase regulatory protein [Parvibaculales bacterium]
MKHFHLHLISDSTGETINAVAHAVCTQFVSVEAKMHAYSLVRSQKALKRVLAAISENPGPVMFSIVDGDMRVTLEKHCEKLRIPCMPVLDPLVATMGAYLNVEIDARPGSQHTLDTNYFRRIAAFNYTIQHDDGQSQGDLDDADIILTGVSRTSKTPTCMYLANRGIKAANVPLVPGVSPPNELLNAKGPLIVGLTNSPERLMHIRKSRLNSLHEEGATNYADPVQIKSETAEARRLFARQKWPVIDVTRRSIEEVSSAILNLYQDYKQQDL